DKQIQGWLAKKLRGEVQSEWITLQLSWTAPTAVTSRKKLDGTFAMVNICTRCKKQKTGLETGHNHPRSICDDGFLSWNQVPYPLANGHQFTKPNPTSKFGAPGVDEGKLRPALIVVVEKVKNKIRLTLDEERLYLFSEKAWDTKAGTWVFEKSQLHQAK
ncbi:hypothetical protein JCM5350_002334, partial [Sporobolomyces pararoseus]